MTLLLLLYDYIVTKCNTLFALSKLHSSVTLGQVMYIYMYNYEYINISCLLKSIDIKLLNCVEIPSSADLLTWNFLGIEAVM